MATPPSTQPQGSGQNPEKGEKGIPVSFSLPIRTRRLLKGVQVENDNPRISSPSTTTPQTASERDNNMCEAASPRFISDSGPSAVEPENAKAESKSLTASENDVKPTPTDAGDGGGREKVAYPNIDDDPEIKALLARSNELAREWKQNKHKHRDCNVPWVEGPMGILGEEDRFVTAGSGTITAPLKSEQDQGPQVKEETQDQAACAAANHVGLNHGGEERKGSEK